MPVEIRVLQEHEIEPFARSVARGFLGDFRPEYLEHYRPLFELDRNLAAFDGDFVAGTAGIFTFQMTVPGGIVPTAGVTRVTVQPTHRRQGVLTALMRRQLEDVRERGEPLAALWASESIIYGRFGYGLAADHVELKVERNRTALAHRVPARGRVRIVTKEEARSAWPGVFDRVRLDQPGAMNRSGAWWDRILRDLEHERHGFSAHVHATYEENGEPQGYLLYRTKDDWTGGLPAGAARLEELMAASPAAYSALWEYALNLDLIGVIEAESRPVDEPLYWMLADPRRLGRSQQDALWLRIVDVPGALSARKYSGEGSVVFEVRDAFCPWVAGRYELQASPGGGKCTRTDRSPTITLSAADLAAIYLGGARLQTLARAGRAEGEPDALRHADEIFAWPTLPWCPNHF
jgi:predicted acetyltransferase